MLIEAFSEAKDPSKPHTNEDRLVILPGRAYAVIDGVTDRLGTRYDGMLSGQYAATIVQGALEQILSASSTPEDGFALVRALTGALERAYKAHGVFEKAKIDWNIRLSAALALVWVRGPSLEVILVGDSGVRLNGRETLRVEKDLDLITSTLRREAWPVIVRKIRNRAQHEQLSRRITWHGTRQAIDAFDGLLTADDMRQIEECAISRSLSALPHMSRDLIEHLVKGGIVNAQGAYQNDSSTILGYACLDGFPVPENLIRIEQFALEKVETVEIYSDGYFEQGAAFGVASWEEAFARAEREDPSKVIHYLSPKGSTEATWADDRAYLGVKF
ncbi:hypothetical protein [Microvirga puerhi]|uniref:Protein phosphatase 2C domain-containing protein n=1 Tax=Microvirga puerhi TaxID=2876078 RepID=A0ABS7VIJ3_9HYPH|nr:hypothetical protein [Microvirga puerhi]MBZ6075328.1 hypothetical protein [Microvirga puerhi]